MIIICIISILLSITLGYLFYLLHLRVEKISQNQAIMVQWFETLRENEEQLLTDLKKIRYEFQNLEKETRHK